MMSELCSQSWVSDWLVNYINLVFSTKGHTLLLHMCIVEADFLFQTMLPSLSACGSWNESFCLSVSFFMGKMGRIVAILTSWNFVGMRRSRRSASWLTLRTVPLGQSLHYLVNFPLPHSLFESPLHMDGTFTFREVISRMHLFQETRPLRILL